MDARAILGRLADVGNWLAGISFIVGGIALIGGIISAWLHLSNQVVVGALGVAALAIVLGALVWKFAGRRFRVIRLRPLKWETILERNTLRYDENRVPVSWHVRKRVKSLVDNQHTYPGERYWLGGSPTSPLPPYRNLAGASVVKEFDSEGWRYIELSFGAVMKRGDEREFSYDIAVEPADAAPPPFFKYLAEEPVRMAIVELTFSSANRPVQIWRALWPTHTAIDPDTKHARVLDQNHFLSEEFSNLQQGRSYGVVWEWKAAPAAPNPTS